jgi:hypothetical protein
MKDKIGMGIAGSNGLMLTGIVSMSLYRLPSLERIEGVPTVIRLRTIGHPFRKTPLPPFASDGSFSTKVARLDIFSLAAGRSGSQIIYNQSVLLRQEGTVLNERARDLVPRDPNLLCA